MPDAGGFRGIGGDDPLTGLLLRPGLVAVAHQEHGVDAACGLRDCGRVAEIAGHDVRTRRRQPPRGVAVRLAGQPPDAMSPGEQGARNRASLLAVRWRR